MNWQETLAQAEQIVDDSKIAPDLRSVAFGRVLGALLGDSPKQSSGADPTEDSKDENSPDDALSSIAAKLSIPREALENIYFADESGVNISIPSSRLDSSKKAATKQLALLVAVGRQAGGIENEGWTADSVIRDVCQEYGVYQAKHFSETLGELDEAFHKRGTPKKREYKLKIPGFEKAAALIKGLNEDG